jgi:hypothetical protein
MRRRNHDAIFYRPLKPSDDEAVRNYEAAPSTNLSGLVQIAVSTILRTGLDAPRYSLLPEHCRYSPIDLSTSLTKSEGTAIRCLWFLGGANASTKSP